MAILRSFRNSHDSSDFIDNTIKKANTEHSFLRITIHNYE